MSYPLQAPDPPSRFRASDCVGEVILVIIGGYHEALATKDYGVKPAERATVVMLTGRAAGSVFEDQIFFGNGQASQFRDKSGGDVTLCRIVKDGKSIVFDRGSAYDEEVANRWITSNRERLDGLRASAVKTFREAVVELAKSAPSGSTPEPSPQFRQPEATMTSLRQPSEPATEDETGY